MATRDALRTFLDDYLSAHEIRDYCPNGLQVEGKQEITKLALGVTASLQFLQEATVWGAEAAVVHHGLFWGGEVRVERSLRARLGTLIQNNMSLFAYHLPLDRHPQVGNNVELAKRLGAASSEPAFELKGKTVGIVARYAPAIPVAELMQRVQTLTNRAPLLIQGGPDTITTLGMCTGAAPEFLREASKLGLDAYLTGEPSEFANHHALEEGIHFIAAGHHATERYGVQALGEHVAAELGIEVRYFEIDNPI